jgi:cell division septation protein DedD
MLQNQKIHNCVLGFLLSLILASSSLAGNLSLIEKRLEELDALNKQAVQQATPLPRHGIITATLKVPPGNSIENLSVQKLSVALFAPHSPFTIQVSSSPQKHRILEVVRHLRKAGIPAFISTPFQHQEKTWWRIFIGSYQTKSDAEQANKELQDQMFPKGFVIKLPYTIQIGVEMTEQETAIMDNELQALGYIPYISPGQKNGMFKVLIGAFKTELEGKDALKEMMNIITKAKVISR